MKRSSATSTRQVDRLFAAAAATSVALAVVVGLRIGQPWAALLLGAAVLLALTGWLWRKRSGTAVAAWGLAGVVVAASIAAVAMVPGRPVAAIGFFVVMSLLPSYRRWPMVVAAGLVFAAAPLVIGVEGKAGGMLVYAAAMLLQTALLAIVALRNEQQARALFDIELLVRAMGDRGAIRLDLDSLRAETPLGERLKAVQERVAATLQRGQGTAVAAAEAAAQLQGSAEQLTARTHHAGEELKSAAMTLSQIAVIVKDSAEAAMQARQTAQQASTLAQGSGQVVSEMVSQMQAIEQASRRITDIIGVIESIAFQTNMLALNAAVEAARAGEQGRGFAVVAGEVRLLAGRAAAASREVKGLIEATAGAVGRGSELAEQARQTIADLTEAVARADGVFHSLSADTFEHAEGIGAMRDAMLELNDSTQRNLEVAGQARSIAAQLSGHARELTDVMAAFRLSGTDVATGAPAAAGPPPPVAAAGQAIAAAAASSAAAAIAATGEAPSPSTPASAAEPAPATAGAAQGAGVEFF
jgi:methyl-accepting chemotaxis protein